MRILLILSIAASVILGLSSRRIMRESESLNAKLFACRSEAGKITRSIQAVEHYPNSPQNDLVSAYLDLMNNIKLINVFNAANTEIAVLGSTDGVNIKDFSRDSPYAGVKILTVGISITARSKINIPPIIESIQKLQKIYPWEITRVKIKETYIEITGDLYGT